MAIVAVIAADNDVMTLDISAEVTSGRRPISSSHIDQIVAEKGLAIVTDTGELERVIGEVVGKNPKAVADFKSGKQAAVGALIGQVMKQAKGADPQTVRTMLVEKLSQSM